MSTAPNLYVYRIKYDLNTAPHIADGILSLTLCKPQLRMNKELKPGDYVLALVALSNLSNKNTERLSKAAYLFRIDEIVSMEGYKGWCSRHSESRICTEDRFTGDCQYFANEQGGPLKYHPGPHPPSEEEKNLKGKNALISRYYAAWTSKTPRVITQRERERHLGIPPVPITKNGKSNKTLEAGPRDFFGIPVIDEAFLISLIEEWRAAHRTTEASSGCGGAGCSSKKRGGVRKTRKSQRRNLTRKCRSK